MPKILGLDLGKKHIGLAISDEGSKIAFPWKTIEIEKGESFEEIITRLIKDEKIVEVVIGNPRNMNGSSSKMSVEAGKFSEIINKSAKIVVHLWDERLSSIEAEKIHISLGESRTKRKTRTHATAAQITLQSFLDNRNRSAGGFGQNE